MATYVEVQGLADFRRAVKLAGGNLDKDLQKELRAAVGPIVADARARFNALGGVGPDPRTAKQVRGSVTQKGISVQLVSKGGYELGREFGSKGVKTSTYTMKLPGGGRTEVTRFFNYAKPTVFGPWTGNRFTLWSTVTPSGNAFFPAVAAGGAKAVTRVLAVIDRAVDRMAA